MTVGRPKKYDNKVKVSGDIEKELRDEIKMMKIPISHLLRLGFEIVKRRDMSAAEYRKRELKRNLLIKQSNLIELQREIDEITNEITIIDEEIKNGKKRKKEIIEQNEINLKILSENKEYIKNKFPIKQPIWKGDEEVISRIQRDLDVEITFDFLWNNYDLIVKEDH